MFSFLPDVILPGLGDSFICYNMHHLTLVNKPKPLAEFKSFPQKKFRSLRYSISRTVFYSKAKIGSRKYLCLPLYK